MEEVIKEITHSVGPKWPQLYSRLGIDYRGRYQITASNESMRPERVKHHQCALDTIRKWQKEPSLQGKDEKECMEILLNCLFKVKGLEEFALKLASQHGIQINKSSSTEEATAAGQPPFEVVTSSSETDSTSAIQKEHLNHEAIIESHSELWATEINIDKRSHKFALLDVCQRMTANHFKQFCTSLNLEKTIIDKIIKTEELLEEKYYHALKESLCNATNPLTFRDLKNGLGSCSRFDLIGLVINRMKDTSS